MPIRRFELPVVRIPFEKAIEFSGSNPIEEYVENVELVLVCTKKWLDADISQQLLSAVFTMTRLA